MSISSATHHRMSSDPTASSVAPAAVDALVDASRRSMGHAARNASAAQNAPVAAPPASPAWEAEYAAKMAAAAQKVKDDFEASKRQVPALAAAAGAAARAKRPTSSAAQGPTVEDVIGLTPTGGPGAYDDPRFAPQPAPASTVYPYLTPGGVEVTLPAVGHVQYGGAETRLSDRNTTQVFGWDGWMDIASFEAQGYTALDAIAATPLGKWGGSGRLKELWNS